MGTSITEDVLSVFNLPRGIFALTFCIKVMKVIWSTDSCLVIIHDIAFTNGLYLMSVLLLNCPSFIIVQTVKLFSSRGRKCLAVLKVSFKLLQWGQRNHSYMYELNVLYIWERWYFDNLLKEYISSYFLVFC